MSYNITEHLIILKTLPFEHPQILIMFIFIFNILKSMEYISGQISFQYIPYYFKEITLQLIIVPQFIQQLVDTILIQVLWYTIKINYIIFNESIIKSMEKLLNLNYAFLLIYGLYILILYKI